MYKEENLDIEKVKWLAQCHTRGRANRWAHSCNQREKNFVPFTIFPPQLNTFLEDKILVEVIIQRELLSGSLGQRRLHMLSRCNLFNLWEGKRSFGSISPKHSPVNWQKEGVWENEVPAWQHILQPKGSNCKWRAVEVIWKYRQITCILTQLLPYVLLFSHSTSGWSQPLCQTTLTHPLINKSIFLTNLSLAFSMSYYYKSKSQSLNKH